MNQTTTNQNASGEAVVSLAVQVGLGILYILITVVAFVGNFLVVVAVSRFDRLKSRMNYFVSSLAFADMTVAVLVLPLSLVYDLTGRWPFDWAFCYFWRSCDIMCCSASLFHLCCISLERYWAISRPLTYATRVSDGMVAVTIAGVWLISMAISFVPVYLGWFALDPATLYLNTGKCDLIVSQVYALFSTAAAFYLPFSVMMASYAAILRIVRTQVLSINTAAPNDGSEQVANDRKALKTLGTVIGVYTLCWLPFFIMYQVLSFCETCQLPFVAISFITWLGYANSGMNPVIYAFMNKDFHWAFKKLLLF